MFLMLSFAYDTNYMLNVLINFSLKDWITTCIIIMIRATIYFLPILCQVASLSRKSRNTWSKRQIWPWNTEWSRAQTNRVCQENALVIANNYTVEVTNRFKGLDLIDRVPDELWIEVRDIVRRQGWRPSPRKRNSRKQNGCLRKPYI